MTISPTVRQIIVIGACQLSSLSAGGAMGYPMVLLHQLSGEDSPIKLDVQSASWIGSMHGIAGIASVITPSFMQRLGRRAAFIFACLAMTLGWIIAFVANSVNIILLSEVIQGFGINSLYVTCILTTSEMASPAFRNVSVQSYAILQSLGMSISGVVSTFLDRKLVCALMAVPIIVALLMTILWPESPSWLACKGRFDESYQTFKLLRKMDSSSKMELKELIAAQKENLLHEKKDGMLPILRSTLRRRDFYLPVAHIIVLLCMVYWSGSTVVIINSFDLMKRMTSNEKAPFWGGVAINVVFFIGMLFSSLVNKRFNTKTVLLTSAVCTSICLFAVSLLTSLKSYGFVSTGSVLPVYFLILFVAFDSTGVVPMVFTIVSEIMPVKHRGIGGAVYIILNCIINSIAMKMSPFLFSFNISVTFLLFTLNAIICALFIWKFVPETKERTLQQIEDFYMSGTFNNTRIQCGESNSCIVVEKLNADVENKVFDNTNITVEYSDIAAQNKTYADDIDD